MKSKRVLIVEDDEVTAMNLKMSLEKQGYVVVAIADDALSAKSKIKVYVPDILIIDISLQESDDGIKLASYIREKQLMPFIFLTASQMISTSLSDPIPFPDVTIPKHVDLLPLTASFAASMISFDDMSG